MSPALPHRAGVSPLAADLTAGVVVFLVALPLCLGIAVASNAPPFAGILAGIVGGIVVGAISKSSTSVSGPAAGLTAVVAAQIALLGSFQAFLLAVTLAGFLQIVLGVVRAGSIADFVPSSVIKGLLAAIGLILVLKQIPHLLGHDTGIVGEMSFQQADQENTFSELLRIVSDTNVSTALIGIASLLLLVAWERIDRLKRSPVPSALVVVLVGVAAHLLLARLGDGWAIGAAHLVKVPVPESWGGVVAFLEPPDFAAFTNPRLYTAAITIALVASLETLLNVEAVDRLDPQKRVTPTNRELIAQGVGNMASGLIGGLPLTSVIVRSSVNINAGGRTRWATIIHGGLLLLCVVMFPTWLNQIPLSCLAAILITTGFKLAKPRLFQQMWREGMNQFLPFMVTVTAIVFTDLLNGILIGLGVSILFILRSNLRRPLDRVVERHIGGDVVHIELANQVSFLNRAALSKALDAVPRNGHVLIDARQTDYVDSDVLDLIREYLEEIAPVRGVQVSLAGLRDHYEQLADRVQYVDYTTRELQASLTPEKVLGILREGNERFCRGRPLTRDLMRQLNATADVRHPLAVVFSGASSRTPVELIFDVGVGDVACVRVTGHAVDSGVLGSLEYACGVAGVKVVLVMGHSNSGLTRMAIEACRRRPVSTPPPAGADCQHMQALVSAVQESISPPCLDRWDELDLETQQARVNEVSRAHVRRVIDRILAQSAALRSRVEQQSVRVAGCFYDVRTGRVDFFE